MSTHSNKGKKMTNHEIPRDHPRYQSLITRERIIDGMHKRIVAEAGLLAAGSGEETPPFALEQERLAIIYLLLAKKPVISVNGNVAVLCPEEIIELGKLINAPLEINLFYRTRERELAIETAMKEAGAEKLLGIDPKRQTTIEEISHQRRIVDVNGIAISDCVFVPLEDGDRTQALKHLQKEVVTVDLNPLSRTSLAASVSITNNISRAVTEMVDIARELKNLPIEELLVERSKLDNRKLLKTALKFMSNRLMKFATEIEY